VADTAALIERFEADGGTRIALSVLSGGSDVREFLRCGSWLVYSTRGRSIASSCVRYVIVRLKRGQVDARSGRSWAHLVIESFATQAPVSLRQLFASPVTLVPVPGCGVSGSSTVWPALALCDGLCRRGLGDDVQPVLRRVEAVPRSAWARGDRPSVEQHLRSFDVAPVPRDVRRILLVDDVVTRGATLLAAARRLAAAYPAVRVDAFALARVQGAGDLEEAIQPCLEHITLTPTGCVRLPFALPERSLRMPSADRDRTAETANGDAELALILCNGVASPAHIRASGRPSHALTPVL
jgi:hypothetical protein